MSSDCTCSDSPNAGGVGNPQGQPRRPDRISFDRIEVLSSSDGLDDTLEATFTFVVNGESRVWEEDLATGDWPIGIEMYASVPNPGDVIELTVSGVENDPWPVGDDPLPAFTRTWRRDDDWGVGPHVDSAINGSVSYRLHYQIACAPANHVVLGRDQMLDLAQQKIEQRQASAARGLQAGTPSAPPPGAGQTPAASDQQKIAWSLNRLERSGYRLSHTTGNEFYFTGNGAPVPGTGAVSAGGTDAPD
jgi:hypothetical protein